MTSSDPFETLGVPKALVAREQEAGRLERIVALADGAYRALSRLYHPDVGGDPELFAELTRAREEIAEDPESVTAFFVGTRGSEVLQRGKEAAQRAERITRRDRARHDSLVRITQNASSTISAPWLRGRACVARVGLGPQPHGLALISSPDDDTGLVEVRYGSISPGADEGSLKLRGQEWYIKVLTSDFEDRMAKLEPAEAGRLRLRREKVREARREAGRPESFADEKPILRARRIHFSPGFSARVIGGVSRSWVERRQAEPSGSSWANDAFMIESPEAPDSGLRWEQMDHAWWSENMHPQCELEGGHLVLARVDGSSQKFALVGPVLRLADLKPAAASGGS